LTFERTDEFLRHDILPREVSRPAQHKYLFGYGGDAWRLGSWVRRLEFFKRAGIGSAVYFDPPTHSYLKLMQQHGILDVTSIFKGGDHAVQKSLIQDYHRTEAELKLIETEAYEKAKKWPEILVWKTVNEPGEKMSENLVEMKEFVRPLVAAYRGIKRANPKAVVLSPDPSNMDPKHGTHFIDVFLQAGGKSSCDVIAIHPYRPRPEEPDLDVDTATFLSVLTKHGYTGDVWFSEGMGNFFMNLPAWGVDVHRSLSQEGGKSGGWRVGNLTYDLGLGEREAAAYAMRYWLVGLKYGHRIKQQINWYYPQNAILDYDLTPGAEIFASSTLKRLLGDASFKQDLKSGDGVRGYVFEDGKRQPVGVIWSHDIRVDKGTGKGPVANLASLPATVEMFDFTGKKVMRTKELQLSPFPFFLRGAVGSTTTLARTLSELPVSGSM
jgi:hypothetical protein